MAQCRSCGAPITWVLTEKGKRMPIDAEPVVDGNVEIVGSQPYGDGGSIFVSRTLKRGEGDLTLTEPPPRYVSHFFTCPDAEKHRKSPTP